MGTAVVFVLFGLLFVLLGAVPLVVQRMEGRLQLFRPDLFFTASFLLYTVPVVVDAIWFDDWIGYGIGISKDELVFALLFSFVFLAFFQIGYYGAASYIVRPRLSGIGVAELARNVAPRWAAVGLVLSGVVMFVYFIYSEFGGVDRYLFEVSRNDRFRGAVGRGYLTLGVYVANCGIVYYYAASLVRAMATGKSSPVIRVNVVAGIVVIAYAIFFALAGDRRQILFLALSMLCVYATINVKKFRILRYVISGSVALVVMQLFSEVRGFSSEPLEMWRFFVDNFEWKWLNLAEGELGAAQMVLSKVHQDFEAYRLGGTYVEAVTHLVPSVLYPDRPPAPTSWFAIKYFPHYYITGGSVGFSVVAESLINFGPFGIMMIGILLGVVLRWWYAKNAGSMSLYRIVVYAASVPFIYMTTRADAASMLKMFVFAVGLPVAVLWLCGRMYATYLRIRRVTYPHAGKPSYSSIV